MNIVILYTLRKFLSINQIWYLLSNYISLKHLVYYIIFLLNEEIVIYLELECSSFTFKTSNFCFVLLNFIYKY